MKLLRVSHIALWAMAEPDRLIRQCRAAIEDGTNDVFFSAASIWELRMR
jgi:PIN domain nuclease of toxin-antitoxin system